jgi:hypothetical protein
MVAERAVRCFDVSNMTSSAHDLSALHHERDALKRGDVRERGGDQLTVWEMFRVYDGQIHAVEAFMRILLVEKRNGGWE